ncbi:Glu/Leu/Phe/Val dehydrogenase [bacterium]|jgi:glutamate dehydrogenase|nr:Glu/Leu/Phe/Val dehydrogenase [bacterium]MBT6293501.1 Glu/Leu/Phe/Val dehydrogenase [bacterium]
MSQYANTLSKILEVTSFTNKDSTYFEFLKVPEKTIHVSFPVRLDNDETIYLNGFRVIHNRKRGPSKGGIRFTECVNMNEVKLLALLMTLKCSLLELPYGGGKGGVIINTINLSENELEQVTRGFVRGIFDDIGPHKDIPAPDMYTNSKIMDIATNEYQKISKSKTYATFTGKSIKNKGLEGRTESTGFGGFVCARNFFKDINGLKVNLQGLGNAGGTIGKYLVDAGAKIICASDSKGSIYNKNGLDYQEILKLKSSKRSVALYNQEHDSLEKDEFLEKDCDLLILAANENVINSSNYKKVKGKVILELANGPINFDSIDFQEMKNKIVIPDILANSGGVVGSYLEWDNNLKNKKSSKTETLEHLDRKISKVFARVLKTSEDLNINLRKASYVEALKNLT